VGGSANDGAGSHIELAAMTGARYGRALQLTCAERTPSMRTRVIEGIKMSSRGRHANLGSVNIEDVQLTCCNLLRATYFYLHGFTSYLFIFQ
jgi:hypothetical protein